jgi:hypothetical protein
MFPLDFSKVVHSACMCMGVEGTQATGVGNRAGTDQNRATWDTERARDTMRARDTNHAWAPCEASASVRAGAAACLHEAGTGVRTSGR